MDTKEREPRRLIPRFRLSTLFTWVVIVAILALWWKDHQRLTAKLKSYGISSGRLGVSWHENEATGKPDTQLAGDQPTAWASATEDGQREWLQLEYAKAIVPTSVVIHETYNPGAVDEISAFKPDGTEVTVWQGTDPTPIGQAKGVSVIPLSIDFLCKSIRVHLDSPRVGGWNEIDAVGLRTRWTTHWAKSATASSTYASGFNPNAVPPGIVLKQQSLPAAGSVRLEGKFPDKQTLDNAL